MSLPPDDDRTVLAPARGISSTEDNTHTLPVGKRLGEFEITGVLGEGGFGIVYLAWDSSLERQVALKEYMPSFARRGPQAQVSVASIQNADSFEAGRRSFINEARLLAQFDHPSLVKVYRFWEANGTAYMVMPYYRGPTLKQALLARAAPPDEAWLTALLAPLLDALELIHRDGCFHRDIAPDNILMLEEGQGPAHDPEHARPLLLDFGAARRAIGDMNQAFTVILKQNYAPIEQYAEMPGMRQGAWTDLYALASTVHFAIDGHAPPPAMGRMMQDPYVPLATRHAGRFSARFLEAIDRALAFKPADRPQDVAAMRALLGIDPAARLPAAAPAPALSPVPPPAGAQPGRGWRRPAVVVAGVGVAALAGLVAWSFSGRETPPAPAAPAAPRPPAVAPAPAPQQAAAMAFDPIAALEGILEGADPERRVTVHVANKRVTIGRDKLGFSIRSSHAGYVYVYMVGTDRNDFQMLFPNAIDGNNRIRSGQALELPRPSWPIKAFGPPGKDHFVVMVSDAPRVFDGAGLAEGGDFSTFPVARAARLQRDYKGVTPLFAGLPACKAAPCPAAYGAVAFSIEELNGTN